MLFLQMFTTMFLFLVGSTYLITLWKSDLTFVAQFLIYALFFGGVLCLTGAWYMAPFMGLVAW